MDPYKLRQCPDCRFRFPVTDNRQPGKRCPQCGAPTILVGHYPQTPSPPAPPSANFTMHALLDNIRSVYNVGSMFRTADGAGIDHLHLCGITPAPDHPKIAKTALGAETAVSWSSHPNSLDTAVQLQNDGFALWMLEETPAAIDLFTAPAPAANVPILLIVGNEITGADPDILALSDRVLHIPMQGVKESLNVATAFGIAAFTVRRLLTVHH